MRRALPGRPSPAMVVALVALFVALGGSGYAAVQLNGKNIKNRSIAGKKLKNNTLTGRQIRESRLGTVPRAREATLLAGRAPASFLPVDGTAANSNNLGGLPPSSWVRRECDQNSGQLKGVATVPASAVFPAVFTSVGGYNCSGQSIEARRLSMGRYEVRFNGSPVTQAVATAIVTGFKADMVSVTNQAAGLFTVYVLDPLPAPGAFVDDAFTIITP
jgi:uncharacterized protein YfaS (alpha-2-macroglobulin family)